MSGRPGYHVNEPVLAGVMTGPDEDELYPYLGPLTAVTDAAAAIIQILPVVSHKIGTYL